MKKLLLFFLLVTAVQYAFAQTFTSEDAGKHIGDSIKICGKVFGGRFFETSNNSPTLLNMGAAFPNNPLTVMIPGNVRMSMGYIPEQELKDKNICVTGTVILFKEKPEIVVYNISQIEIQK